MDEIDNLIDSEEALTDHHFASDQLSEQATKAADALDIAADATEEDARIISFDRTSEKDDAEICGIYVTDGKGKVLADLPIRTEQSIDRKHARENKIDPEKVKTADNFQNVYGKVNESLKNAKLVVFRTEKDYKAFLSQVESLKVDNVVTPVTATKALLKDTGVCMSNVSNAVCSEIEHWHEPVVQKFMRIIRESLSGVRHEGHKETIALANLYKAQRENETIYQEKKRELEGALTKARENIVLAKENLRKGNEDRLLLYRTQRAELREKIKEAKKEAKVEAKQQKLDSAIWSPTPRFSLKWLSMPRHERILEKRMVELFPQNVGPSSSWHIDAKAAKGKEKATNLDVRKAREKLLRDLAGPAPEKKPTKSKPVEKRKTQNKARTRRS